MNNCSHVRSTAEHELLSWTTLVRSISAWPPELPGKLPARRVENSMTSHNPPQHVQQTTILITDNDTKHINKLLTPIHGGSGHADWLSMVLRLRQHNIGYTTCRPTLPSAYPVQQWPVALIWCSLSTEIAARCPHLFVFDISCIRQLELTSSITKYVLLANFLSIGCKNRMKVCSCKDVLCWAETRSSYDTCLDFCKRQALSSILCIDQCKSSYPIVDTLWLFQSRHLVHQHYMMNRIKSFRNVKQVDKYSQWSIVERNRVHQSNNRGCRRASLSEGSDDTPHQTDL